MSLTTTIRFLDPIDPRAVWSAMATIIEAPAGYWWHTTGKDEWLRDIYRDIPTWFAEPGQGAKALASMHYGPEGSLVDDTEWSDPGYHPNQVPPPAYVEIRLTNGIRERHDEFAGNLITWAKWNGVRAVRDYEYSDGWASYQQQLQEV